MIDKRIKLIDITSRTANQIEASFNQNLGDKGWYYKDVFTKGSKTFMVVERIRKS